ncbi:MAG: hypothetical protein AAF348_19015 [Bacteroidota bacterium]
MTKKATGKILNRIFEESERSTYSTEDLDNKLEQLGVNPNLLVKQGLERIGKLLENQEKPLEENQLKSDRFLMAAKKKNKNLGLDKEIKKIKNKKNK